MKKYLLIALCFVCALDSSVFAFSTSNLAGLGGANNANGETMRWYYLKHDKTTLYCTGWIKEDTFNQMERDGEVPCHKATRQCMIDYFSQKTGSFGFPSNFDGNGNGIPDWHELIAGGEPLYWKDLGNGWQFYVNGAMYACNSDTGWENVLFKDTPQAQTPDWPDENHNGIPDVVDAAIAAGGGATSEGGNITVTVENKTFNVTVDNAPVLQAINNLSEQIAQIQTVGGTGGGSDKDYTEILQKIYAEVYATHNLQKAYLPDMVELLNEISVDVNANLPEIKVSVSGIEDKTIDIRDILTTIDHRLESSLLIMANHLANIDTTTSNILTHLQQTQQPTLETIAGNTATTNNKIGEIINILNKWDKSEFGGIENKPEKEEAEDIVSESSESIDQMKRQFEEEDKKGEEDEADKIKNNNNGNTNTNATRIRDKIMGALGIDLQKLRQSKQEEEEVTIKISNGKMIEAIGGGLPRASLTMDLHLDPRKWSNGNWDESENLQGSHAATVGTFAQYIVPYMDIARNLILFVFGWAFISSLFDLFRDAWSY